MDNEGPHCRNCHTGASSCNQCHGVTTTGAANPSFGTALLTEGVSVFGGDAYLHTVAVTDVSGKCIDGGFSYPHRTLGANLLKDELYGVNFDGTPVAAGDVRSVATLASASWETSNYPLPWARSQTSETATVTTGAAMVWESGEQLDGKAAENLDSVCIDCHGDATTWNGDNPTLYKGVKGWELLWKGLP